MFAFDPDSAERRKAQRREVLEILRSTAPQSLLAVAREGTLKAFARAREQVPAYRTLLAEAWGDASRAIDTLEAFQRHVPLIDKHCTFGRFPVRELCAGGSLQGVRSVLTSSGHSGVFSFGVNTAENVSNSAHAIDLGLQYMFDVDGRRTLLINALPMGVKVHTTATSLAETSVRDDMVHAAIQAFAPDFEQIILVGEGSFIKKIAEDGIARGVDWHKLPVNVIVGEEGIAENYRTYMAALMGLDLSGQGKKHLVSSMGVAELDLNIFHETRDTIRIRRLAHEDPKLRAALFGEGARYCPMFFVYYPHRCLVETCEAAGGREELVLSMLSEQMRIPLLRYRTGDLGRPMTQEEVGRALKQCGYDFAPELKLPFVAVWGRDPEVEGAKGVLSAGAVKEALYAGQDVAGLATGNFVLRGEGEPALDMQLKPGCSIAPQQEDAFRHALAAYSDAAPEVRWRAYETFPSGMTLDYERKFNYRGRGHT